MRRGETEPPARRLVCSKVAPTPKNIPDEGLFLGYNTVRGEKVKIDKFILFCLLAADSPIANADAAAATGVPAESRFAHREQRVEVAHAHGGPAVEHAGAGVCAFGRIDVNDQAEVRIKLVKAAG